VELTVSAVAHLADPDQAFQHAYGGSRLAALLCLALLLVVCHQHLQCKKHIVNQQASRRSVIMLAPRTGAGKKPAS
jgi:hypothetical protein